MFGWIPFIGPIIQGLFNTVSGIYSKFKDTQLGMRQADVEEAKVSAQIIHDTNDDIGLRIMRDAACLPVVVWMSLIGWDTILSGRDRLGVMYHPWAKDLIWHVPDYPFSVSYIPYVVIAFLFGNIGFNIWKRR